MINLIPNEEKKLMIKSFYYRLSIMLFMAFGLIILVASVALLPSYFLSSAKENSIAKKLEIEKVGPANVIDQEMLSIISALDNKLTLLEKAGQNKFLVSQKIFSEIISKKISTVRITEISFKNDEKEGRKVSIRGTASSREKLLLFRQALEDDPLFKKVDLPISNFVKGSNIQFFLNLIPS